MSWFRCSDSGNVTVPASRLVLKWYVVATGSEVAGAVDLSDTTVNILVVGTN